MDIVEALAASLNTNGTLTASGAFGREGWLWIGRAPASTAFPYGVLFDSSNSPEYESPGAGGYVPVIERVGVQISLYADDRAEARTLSGLVRAAVNDASLPLGSGDLMVIRATAYNVELDPDPGPDGSDVWQAVIQFEAMVNTSI